MIYAAAPHPAGAYVGAKPRRHAAPRDGDTVHANLEPLRFARQHRGDAGAVSCVFRAFFTRFLNAFRVPGAWRGRVRTFQVRKA